MSSFVQYSDILLDSFSGNLKYLDIVSKKSDLFESVLNHYQLTDANVLFVGFSPWCLNLKSKSFDITEVTDQVLNFLDSKNCHYQFTPLAELQGKYDVIVAGDEYFTFANSDQEQRQLVDRLSEVAKNIIITTLRDYKNQDFKDREFSQPILIRGDAGNKIYLEHYDYDLRDKNASTSKLYVVEDSTSKMFGPFARRNMYFKQLAKFSIDAGASNFYVHKNLMYKSIIKKNYEHVITIQF